MRLTENVKIGGVPEGATVPNFDDVVNMDLVFAAHVGGAPGGRASHTITADDLLAEATPAC